MMWSIALRWSASRWLSSFMSPIMCIKARRRSSPLTTRFSSVLMCSSSLDSFSRTSSSVRVSNHCCALTETICLVCSALRRGLANLLPEPLQLLLQCNHFQFAPYHYFFELLQVQDLFLKLRLRLLKVPHDQFVRPHVTQNSDRANHLAIRITQRRRIQRGRNDFA